MSKQVLILGSQGHFGAAAASAFSQAGWRVLCHARRPDAVLPAGARRVDTPLTDTDALARQAEGSALVIHAANVPYPRWAREALPLARQASAVAGRLGATLLLPGNVYNYSAPMPSPLLETAAQTPHTAKGAIRVAIEQHLQERSQGGQRCIVLRAGDFLVGGARGWLGQAITKSIEDGKLVYPGRLDAPHAWAHLPDLARVAVALAERTDLPAFARFHFAGHTLTGQQLLDAIEQAARRLGLGGAAPFKRGTMPWGLIRTLGLVVPMYRELAEMAYLWETPHALDGSALKRLLGDVPQTPLATVLQGCLRGQVPVPA
jgi:nucleoside-diphosphate-sugar epimerase